MTEQSPGSAGPALCVVVSPEMTILRGRGPLPPGPIPTGALAVAFDMGPNRPSLAVVGAQRVPALLSQPEASVRVIALMAPEVVRRLGGSFIPTPETEHAFHLPCELRGVALSIRDYTRTGQAAEIYLSAKSIALVYETWAMLDEDGLTPMALCSDLSQADCDKIVAARRLIEDRWHEKLSLNQLAAACGLNREKLTRGFREMFACSVGEALAEQRLKQASRMLLTTDLPVSSVGFENGYLNNASFTRAFGRRFGVSPSDFRARRLAA